MIIPALLPLLLCLLRLVAGNINYRSPSINHPVYAVTPPVSLGIRAKRDFATQRNLTFTHGVASGDPYADSVILWTRAVPEGVDADAHVYVGEEETCVRWQVAEDEGFGRVVDEGDTVTSGEVDWTVKVGAGGLRAKTRYWYRFGGCAGGWGGVGRTKTLPEEGDEVEEGVRFAVYSCSNFAEGWFNAYGMSARKGSVDYVLHLGDYIYEMPLPTTYKDRIPMPLKETIQLEDYRMRYATHRTDEDLLLSHKLLPWIPVWDDHEIANNGWMGGSTSPIWMHLELTSWEQRVRNGLRAYFEWMPVRQVDADDSMRIWRNFKIGKLADLILLDTRYYNRDETDRPDLRDVEDRSIMGAKQEQWLYGQLEDSARRNVSWTVLGQQIQFSAINETAIGNSSKDLPLYWDGWSGYAANRRRVLEAMVSSNVSNPVVLTGDYHTLWTAELCWDDLAGYDHVSGKGSLGLELAVTSVTSRNGYGPLSYQQSFEVSKRLVRDNAFLKWTEGYYRGYFELELRREALEARYFAVPDVSRRNTEEREIARWRSDAGSRRFARPFGEVTEGAVQEAVEEWALEGITGERR